MAALAVTALFGCAAPTPAPAPSPTPADTAAAASGQRSAAAQQVLDDFATAAKTQDRSAYDQTLSTRDPVFADRARMLFDNLGQLTPVRLEARLQPGPQPLGAPRQSLLGPDAWTQPVLLVWQLPGDADAAEHTVWLTFVAEGGRELVAGTSDRPAATPAGPQPSWWLGPVQSRRTGGVTVVTGSGQVPDRWLTRAERARSDVRRGLPAGAADGLDPVVVEVPATTADFAAVVGVAADDYADVAAVTVAAGATPTAARRVVVNPAAARRLTAEGLAVTLTHETVHAVTRSPSSPAPAWAVEGLADYVALATHPHVRAEVERPLLSRTRSEGAPVRLPTDADFAAAAPRLDLAYAEAESICRYVAQTSSVSRLGELYRALDQGRTIDQAAAEVLGVSSTELSDGWRRWLTARAR